jgi:hypothetical protein
VSTNTAAGIDGVSITAAANVRDEGRVPSQSALVLLCAGVATLALRRWAAA